MRFVSSLDRGTLFGPVGMFLLRSKLDIAIRQGLPEHDLLFVGDGIPRQEFAVCRHKLMRWPPHGIQDITAKTVADSSAPALIVHRDHPEIRIINAAVDATARERILYTVFGPEAPDWAGGLLSFDRETIAKHEKWCPGLSAMIHEESVSCLPFDTILAELPGDRIDILQIDTEGADGLILSLFPFDRIRPAIVQYEIKHLDKAEQEQALTLLLKHGYRLARSGAEDMLAVIG